MDFSEITQQAKDLLDKLDRLVGDFESMQQDPEIEAKSEQLKIISSSIDRLETKKLSVPEDLRRLKMNLHMELNRTQQMIEANDFIEQELSSLLARIHKNKPLQQSKRQTSQGQRRQRRLKGTTTPQSTFEPLIIAALKAHNGKAPVRVVLDWIKENHHDRLLPGDHDRHASGDIIWKNNVKWQRAKMVSSGVLKSNSQHGIWEIEERKP